MVSLGGSDDAPQSPQAGGANGMCWNIGVGLNEAEGEDCLVSLILVASQIAGYQLVQCRLAFSHCCCKHSAVYKKLSPNY